MELKMEVYTPELELIGMLEAYNSIIFEKKAFSCGSFSINALITDETKRLLVPDNIIWIEGDTAGIIEYIEQQENEQGPYITVKGRDLTGILDRRVLWGRYSLKGAAAEIMRKLISECCVEPTRGNTALRKIPELVIAEKGTDESTEKIRIQRMGDNLLETLEEIGKANRVSFGVRFNAKIPQMEFWTRQCEDRSINQTDHDPVFYSTELDDVLSSEYSYNSEDYRNTALIAGEGEGDDRRQVTLEDTSKGLSRRELYVDARDLQSDSDPDNPIPEEEYMQLLSSRGKEKLAENQLVQSFSAEVRMLNPTYEYGKDYKIGDTITVIDERIGVKTDAVVQGVRQSADGDIESMSLTLGFGQPTIYDVLKRKAVK